MEIWILSAASDSESTAHIFKKLLDRDEANVLPDLRAKISHLEEHGGHPSPPIAKLLKSTKGELCEIRQKFGEKDLLRIYYFIDRERRRMVLLNYTLKPNGRKFPSRYDNKKVERKIQEEIQKASNLKTKYLISQDNYEPLIV